MFKGARAEING